MRTRLLGAAIVMGATLASTFTTVALAQPARDFVEKLPLPPAEGWQLQRVFDMDLFETGANWLETSVRNYGVDGGNTADANNFAYIRVELMGSPGQIYVSSGWDYNGTPIDPPARRSDGRVGDDCAHSHHVGAVYWRVEAPRMSGYYLVGSHGQLGMRMDANWVEQDYGILQSPGTCAVTSEWSRIYRNLNVFRWASHPEGYTLDVDPLYTKEVVLAAQSPTHGTGACPNFECFAPVAFLIAQTDVRDR